jgi:hypothetical protein
VAAGLIVGTGIVWAGGGLVRALLFQVAPTDPWTIAGVVAMLSIVGAIASLGPAIRAARCDVAGILRQE